MKHVIIGNGIAGICGAQTLREQDPDKAATLIIRHIEDKRKALELDAR